eukprot:NODE_789_length_1196_cov_51.478017_g748_i0.p1 GENE.NODE_789_length_1196_cov_51.478017_g748_i0~~NODE_789_length_1196_cov_51.478017_g748_i0.p1  ORF type:complete len:327 (-),score=57.80 NODE_789_length_1196_cov_51.478017_g748_i0:40-1020(-)
MPARLSPRQTARRQRSRGRKAIQELSAGETPELDKQELQVMLTQAERKIKVLQQDGHSTEDKRKRQLEDAQNQISRERAERFSIQTELEDRIRELEKVIEETEEFRREKASMVVKIAELEETIARLHADHATAFQEQAAKNSADREELRAELVRRLRKTQGKLFRLTDDHLHIKTQKMLSDNERLTQDVELYHKESKELLQANQALVQANEELKQAVQVQNANNEALIRKAHSHEITIQTLLAKIKSLEASAEESRTSLTDEKSRKILALSETVDKQYDIICDLRRELDEVRESGGGAPYSADRVAVAAPPFPPLGTRSPRVLSAR